jgi:hypothetical protein
MINLEFNYLDLSMIRERGERGGDKLLLLLLLLFHNRRHEPGAAHLESC